MTNEIKMTEVQALRNALAGQLDEQTVEKLNHMIEVRSRKRDRKPNTAKREANIALGEKFAEIWDEETFKAANVAEILEVSKPKANAICKAMGWEVVPTTEKVKVYKLQIQVRGLSRVPHYEPTRPRTVFPFSRRAGYFFNKN